jgi:hypothetical protein
MMEGQNTSWQTFRKGMAGNVDANSLFEDVSFAAQQMSLLKHRGSIVLISGRTMVFFANMFLVLALVS